MTCDSLPFLKEEIEINPKWKAQTDVLILSFRVDGLVAWSSCLIFKSVYIDEKRVSI